MTGRKQQQLGRAAREAHRAADRARDFAALCESVAAMIQRAEIDGAGQQLSRAKDKFAEVREALSDSEDWFNMADNAASNRFAHRAFA